MSRRVIVWVMTTPVVAGLVLASCGDGDQAHIASLTATSPPILSTATRNLLSTPLPSDSIDLGTEPLWNFEHAESRLGWKLLRLR